MVTVASTGDRYNSYPDRLIGLRFMEGYAYDARLQHIATNLNLCAQEDDNDDDKTPNVVNYNITMPTDGRKVALLASSSGCSDIVKARMAAYNMDPANIVKYLIIFNDDEQGVSGHEATPSSSRSDNDVHSSSNPVFYDDIPIGVVHVSLQSGHDLLNLMYSQDETVKELGGPRIWLDGRDTSRSKYVRTILFWVGITFMLSGCCCSFLLSIRMQEILGLADEGGQQPQRPERRRLTPLQVQDMLPISDYSEEHEDDESDGDCGHLLECTICLEEFEIGDKLRTLPCGHFYHCECVTRWLIQRSSTCPLCKLDLYVDEEEEEESSEEEEEDEGLVAPAQDYVALEDGSGSGGSDGQQQHPPRRRQTSRILALFQSGWERLRSNNNNSASPVMEGEMVSTQPLLSEAEEETNDILDDDRSSASASPTPPVLEVV